MLRGGAIIGKNAVENNYLNAQELLKLKILIVR
ncbi:VENN motif pre-toxin domain-containing protein [Thorsellia anophelis]